MNPRTIAVGETEAGFETKYPMMTAKPIIAQLMGLSIEIEARRFKVAAPESLYLRKVALVTL